MADLKKKSQTVVTRQNVLESLKDLGGSATVQTKDLLKNTSEDFFRELLGFPRTKVKRSGELSPGETLQVGDVLSGAEEENKRLKSQVSLEKHLLNEEAKVSREKSSELRVQLQAIMQEVQKIAASTQNLAEATQASIISAPVEPGIYHIRFFESLLDFLQSFRKRIDLSTTWLQSTNKRAEKKNYWSMYKKKGSSFLLSPDHYLQRSAG